MEDGQRFPSARTLRNIAGPLAFGELELFACAHYLSPESTNVVDGEAQTENLDPHMVIVLSREPVELQRAVVGVITVLKALHVYTRNDVYPGEGSVLVHPRKVS